MNFRDYPDCEAKRILMAEEPFEEAKKSAVDIEEDAAESCVWCLFDDKSELAFHEGVAFSMSVTYGLDGEMGEEVSIAEMSGASVH